MNAPGAKARRIAYRRLADSPSAADVAVKFCRHAGGCALESVCNTAGYGRYSIFGIAPVAALDARADDARAVAAVCIRLSRVWPLDRPSAIAHLPFVGGWIGCFPYEAGAAQEKSVPTRTRLDVSTHVRFHLYDSAAVYDHVAREWHVCALDLPESQMPAQRRLQVLEESIREAPRQPAPDLAAPPGGNPRPTAEWRREDYLRAVDRAIRYIAAGDIYQVNLTQRFTTRVPFDPVGLYQRLRAANPADFAACLVWKDHAVLSASPELFLQVGPDREVVTRPIKGTIPRGVTSTDDALAASRLLASLKDRSELNMIIDLQRNDLGRVCEVGSVRVLADAAVETHPTVLHLVGTIAGRLRADTTIADLLRATLPGGSITGCPKVRAMQIIDELEPTPRGAYCGALGFVGIDGRVGLNLAIRTMQLRPDREGAAWLHLHAGGAITADSDPDAEYAETLAKAEGMFRALGHTTAALDAAPAVR